MLSGERRPSESPRRFGWSHSVTIQVTSSLPRSEAALELEFDALMARSGLDIPTEWRAGTLDNYVDLRQAAELLRGALPADLEPSNVFDSSRVASS